MIWKKNESDPNEPAPTDLATLLARVAAPERRGFDPMCNGVT